MDANPYPGPNPITISSKLGGRDEDIAVVRSHLLARRWTVVHGHSGVGKSSLFAAGIKDRMSRHRVLILSRWTDSDPLHLRLARELALPAGDSPAVEAKIRGEFQDGRKLILILDQFEEYLRDRSAHCTGSDDLLARLMGEDFAVHVCAGIREDELFRLDRLRRAKINPFANLIALRNLTEDGARQAVWKPLEGLADPGGLTDEHVNRLVRKLRDPNGGGIAASTLAIVCIGGWDLHVSSRRDLFAGDSDIRDAIASYCQTQLLRICSIKDTIARGKAGAIFKALMDKDSHRISRTAAEISARAEPAQPQEWLLEMLGDLVEARLLDRSQKDSGMPGEYSIVGDLFVEPLQEWMSEQTGTTSTSKTEDVSESEKDYRNWLNSRRRLAGLALSVEWGATALERMREELGSVWDTTQGIGLKHRDTGMDEESRIILRRLGARFLKPGMPEIVRSVQIESEPRRLREADRSLEIWRRSEKAAIVRTEGKLRNFSFTSTGEYVAAVDDRSFVYVWDLAGKPIFRIPGDEQAFAAVLLTPEEIYDALMGEARPRQAKSPRGQYDAALDYSFEDLAN